MGAGNFFAISASVPWLLSEQDGLFAQGFNRDISAALVPIAWMALRMCWLVVLALFIGSYQHYKSLDTFTPYANGWRWFGSMLAKAFRLQGYSVHKTGIGDTGGGIDLVLPKDRTSALVQGKQIGTSALGRKGCVRINLEVIS
ncbi:hypothetical protein [Xanthomonas arboricola]|uniref:hypothetical protein n=1 Tax=Xanthomonas arboricola TaxID=56448 RepID=UPI0015E06342|nr:hypothetical protein [Xanthomonas arboricola]